MRCGDWLAAGAGEAMRALHITRLCSWSMHAACCMPSARHSRFPIPADVARRQRRRTGSAAAGVAAGNSAGRSLAAAGTQGYREFFVQTVPVAPNRFRPVNHVGEMVRRPPAANPPHLATPKPQLANPKPQPPTPPCPFAPRSDSCWAASEPHPACHGQQQAIRMALTSWRTGAGHRLPPSPPAPCSQDVAAHHHTCLASAACRCMSTPRMCCWSS